MKKGKIVYFLLIITSMIDLLNGFCLQQMPDSPLSVGQIFRIILIITLLICIFQMNDDKMKIIFFIYFGYFIIDTIMTIFYHESLKILFNDLSNVTKIVLPIMIIIVCYDLSRKGFFREWQINKIIIFNMRFISIALIILKVFNLGNSAYVGEVGFKGYFNSNNELSIVLSIMFIYNLERLFVFSFSKKKGSKTVIIDILLNTLTLVLIGAKTCYIIIAFSLLVYLIRLLQYWKKLSPAKITVMLIIVSVVGVVAVNVFYNDIDNIIAKQQYYFANRDLLSFVLSDRNLYLSQMWDIYVKGNINALTLFFGFRKYEFFNYATSFINIELDGHVIFINYGIIGAMLILAFYLKIFVKCKKSSFYKKMSYFIYLAFSLLAGHVMFGVFAGTFLALNCASMMAEVIEKTKYKN